MNDILILAGTGKTGRRVAQRLRDAGHSVRTASRTGGDVVFDLSDPSTWPAALAGVTAAYLVEPQPQGTEEGQRRIPSLVTAATEAGVRRLVLLTAPGVEGRPGHPLWQAERAVRESGLTWTVVQPNWFAQNFSEAFWLAGIRAGTLALPTGTGATAFVDAEDIADVAATALTDDGHHGQTYVLTGPRAISFGEAVDLIGKATDRTIRHVDVTAEEFTRTQIAAGVPTATAHHLTSIYVPIRTGEAATLHDGVQRALGRTPRPFEDYVTTTAKTGVWHRD